MPSLTVRSFAEMINLPMYAQYRILQEQKYPDEGASPFKIPYYKPSLDIMKDFYNSGNDEVVISNWLENRTQQIRPISRKENNIRVLKTFITSPISRRKLQIKNRKYSLSSYPKEEVELKLFFDIEAIEEGKSIYQFYNFRITAIEPKIAKDTIYIAYWIMQKNHIKCDIAQIEFIDLVSNIIYKVKRQSSRTIANMMNNSDLVKAIWNSI